MHKEQCWRIKGVWGKQFPRCERLLHIVHCRNCDVFIQYGKELFLRESPQDYLDEFTQVISQPIDQTSHKIISVMIFRLAKEWFALQSNTIQEIVPVNAVHSIPHRDKNLLKGIVNIRGELYLCISLKTLLSLQPEKQTHPKHAVYQRMIVMINNQLSWVFQADEIHGTEYFPEDQLMAIQSSTSHKKSTFTNHIIQWQHLTISLLDDSCIHQALMEKVK